MGLIKQIACVLFFLALSFQTVAQGQLAVKVDVEALQGNTLRIWLQPADAVQSRTQFVAVFRGQKAPLYADASGALLGLMPISSTEAPGSFPLVVQDASGKVRFQQTVSVKDAKFRIQNIRATSSMKALKPMAGEMEAIRDLQQSADPVRSWMEPFVSPTPQCMNSPFGVQRFHNGKPTGNFHRGVDHRSPAGTPVRATTDGVVKISRMFRLHGGTVGVDHGQGVSSIYIHLSKLAVKEGVSVRKGDVIGYVGSTGFATGPYLHWGLYVNGLPVNPLQWLPEIQACK